MFLETRYLARPEIGKIYKTDLLYNLLETNGAKTWLLRLEHEFFSTCGFYIKRKSGIRKACQAAVILRAEVRTNTSATGKDVMVAIKHLLKSPKVFFAMKDDLINETTLPSL